MELILFTVPLGMVYKPADVNCLFLFSITFTITSPIQFLQPNTYSNQQFTMSATNSSTTSTRALTAVPPQGANIAQTTGGQPTVGHQTDNNSTRNNNIPYGSTPYSQQLTQLGGPGSPGGHQWELSEAATLLYKRWHGEKEKPEDDPPHVSSDCRLCSEWRLISETSAK